MKNKYSIFILIAVLMTSVCLLTCSIEENPIIEKWWLANPYEDDPDYVAIIKDMPVLIYQTIIETETIYEEVIIYVPQEVVVEKPLPPEVLMQYIDILDIQFVIFAGESTTFNEVHGPGGATNLNDFEIKTNKSIVEYLAKDMEENDNHFLILHGHANKISGSSEEANELARISTERAVSVEDAVIKEIESHGITDLDLHARMTAKGYGGGMSLSGPSSTYSGLNRRVEAILFTVNTKAAADTYK